MKTRNTAASSRPVDPGFAAGGGVQFLESDNVAVGGGEAHEARIKDPLWFLARQWQSGEFEAENGGRVAQMEVGYTTRPVDRLVHGGGETKITPETPLCRAVESEEEGATSAAWRGEALEYAFEVHAGPVRLAAEEYHGVGLDWHHFDLEGSFPRPPRVETRRVIPTALAYHGMPHSRWWRFEEGRVFVEGADDEEPNVLSMVLPEFLYADANNWYVVPMEQPVGTVRVMAHVRVIDSFGTVTPLDPVERDGNWGVFNHSGPQRAKGTKGPGGGPDLLFVPNAGVPVIEGQVLEEVAFIRDEEANLAWAVERRYQDSATGEPVYRPDEETAGEPFEAADGGSAENPAYRLKSPTAAYWIPYVPRRTGEEGETYLRRARSLESADGDNPQYKGRIIGESWRLNEEEVPRTGVQVQRLWRFVRGADGEGHFWVGRRKRPGGRERGSGLKFDYLE